ncbi:MAG: SUMF1/EgtB/PvdO family nonheme iron enzyme, partial [Myxococcales bacterium]|nr:SUMF1/EgtB/PvdO family nonheme iron enzyme [Myxococcales bacterium]
MAAVTSFYVDSTEVTVGQYKQFLAATNNGMDTGGQPPECAWNTTYQSPMPMNPDTFPMTFIDWCDARAFCQWADKHLCGKIGGGPVVFDENSDAGDPAFMPSVSQWFLACGGPGGSPHPSNADMCNSNGGFGNLVPVGTMPGCEGYYPGLFDLEGNAAEWIDDCDGPADAGTDGGPANDICHLMGGSYVDNKSYCDEVTYDYPRNTTAVTFGFRCCGG